MDDFSFDRDAASKADKPKYVTESGYYDVIIKTAILKSSRDSQSKSIEFDFVEANDGRACNYSRLVTHKKNGERAFGFGVYSALLGLLRIISVSPVQVGDKLHFTELEGRKIGVALQKEFYNRTNGTPGWKMVPLHFYDVTTHKTFSELSENKEAKSWGQPITDKLPIGGAKAAPAEEPLPF